MKKSTRILAVLMAMVMLFSSFAVVGNAFQDYKGSAIANSYDDVDSPTFSLEQYASMALDEVDRMLAEEQIVVDIYIGTLDLSSVSGTIASLEELLTSVKTLLPLLGDAEALTIKSLEGKRRNTTADLDIIKALLDFLADNAGIFEKYANGSLSVGILDSFVASYVFDVRELVIGLIYGMLPAGEAAEFDYMENGAEGIPDKYIDPENGAAVLLQDLLNSLVLGEWVKLDQTKEELLAADPDYAGDYGLYLEDPLDHVEYKDYDFEGEYDPKTYDYYGWVHPNQWVTYAFGGCKRVTAGAAAPAEDYANLSIITDKTGYEFIENLLQIAYNKLLVPVLNEQTRPWLRKMCGIVYEDSKARRSIYDENLQKWVVNPEYIEGYEGEDYTAEDLNEYAEIFNVNAKAEEYTVPEGSTLINEFNTILGNFAKNVLVVEPGVATEEGYTWTWDYDGGNAVLFQNICSIARFVLQITGDMLFSDYTKVPTADEIGAMNDQQVVAFIMRAILNSSVDWLYVDETNQTIVDVGYAAVEQLAWQDIPQYTYTKPVRADFGSDVAYYEAVVDKCLDILFDVAVYNLNQGFDMVPASGSSPATGAGLIPYQGDGEDASYENTLVQIAAWAFNNYAPILALEFNSDDTNGEAAGLTADMVWSDIDTLLNAIIPLKGGDENRKPWISAEIAGDGTTIVSRAFIFDYLLKPIYTLNATNLAKIFDKNPNGAFAEDNGIEIIVNLLEGVFDLLFPNVFSNTVTTIDGLLDNTTLGTMIYDLISSLGTKSFTGKTNGVAIAGRADDLAAVALPVACMLLGLSDDQEFDQIEIFLPETIAVGDAPVFRVYNSSSGINTGYTNTSGQFTQDNLYTYKVTQAYVETYLGSEQGTATLSGIAAGTSLAGGDHVEVTLTPSSDNPFAEGMLVAVFVKYDVYGETSTTEPIIKDILTTVYAYVGNVAESDDEIVEEINVGDRTIEYSTEMYIGSGEGLGEIDGYNIRIRDSKENESVEEPPVTGHATVSSVSNTSTQYPFAALNTDEKQKVEFKGQGGVGALYPFVVAENGTDENGEIKYFERLEYEYEVDENGELVLDANGDPIKTDRHNGGVPDGKYTVTSVINVAGTNQPVTTNIHLYNDYGLGSMFSRAISANRQQTDYDTDRENGIATEYWADYVAALKNAATLCMRPKEGDTFENDIQATVAGYDNLYEQYADALESAIATLKPYEIGGDSGSIIEQLDAKSGYNYENRTYTTPDGYTYNYRVEKNYYDTDYVFFGMTDYVPHTYNRYKDARNDAHGLIEEDMLFGPAPFSDVDVYGENYEPTEEEQAAYNEAVEAHKKLVAESSAINAIDTKYTLHKLNLTYGRLIKLNANVSKLAVVIDMCITNGNVNAGGASYYTTESWENYQYAKAFAEEVYAMRSSSALEPSRVNRATSELVESWKKLVRSCDFTALDAALAQYKETYELGENQAAYTKDTYDAFVAAYEKADRVDRNMGNTESNNKEIADIVKELKDAYDALEDYVADVTPSWTISEEVTGDFFSFGYTFESAPYIDTDKYQNYGSAVVSNDYGENDVTGYILGAGAELDYEDPYLNIFQDLQNARVEVTPNEMGMYSTGAVVQVINDTTDEVVETYIIVLVGDVTGDGYGDGADSLDMLYEEALMHDGEWLYDDNLGHLAAAGDIDDSFSVDAGDSLTMDYVGAAMADINQETLEVVYDI